jgi:hypothetical protein
MKLGERKRAFVERQFFMEMKKNKERKENRFD